MMVRIDSTAVSDTIYVKGINSCGESQWNYLYIQVKQEGNPVGLVPHRISWTCYPNPFRNKLHLVASSVEQGQRNIILEVYDVAGRLVKVCQTKIQPHITLDWQDLPSGMYVVKIINGFQREWIKIMKQQP
jgi:hypothetical protein